MVLGMQTHKQSQPTMVNAMMEEVDELCASPQKKPLTECVGWGPLRSGKQGGFLSEVGGQVQGKPGEKGVPNSRNRIFRGQRMRGKIAYSRNHKWPISLENITLLGELQEIRRGEKQGLEC